MTVYGTCQRGLAAAFALLVLLLLAVRPEPGGGASLPGVGTLPVLCPRRRAGLSCPSCGVTRGLSLALRGRLRDAARLHPSAPALAFLVLAQVLGRILLARAPLRGRAALLAGAADFVLHVAVTAPLLLAPR